METCSAFSPKRLVDAGYWRALRCGLVNSSLIFFATSTPELHNKIAGDSTNLHLLTAEM